MPQFILILWAHDNDVGHVSEIGDVKGAVMRGAILSYNTASINSKDHRKVLKTNIENNLIVCPLKEG